MKDFSSLFGGIEAGGTKFVCMVASSPDKIIEETRFPTTQPIETIRRTVSFFKPFTDRGELGSIGIGSFGPVDLDEKSPTFGYITSTPKPGWSQVALRDQIQQDLALPVVFDTDVNAAALGEYLWGAGRNHDPFIYLTIGTGIGGGLILNGQPVHGLVHPEMGHMPLPHDRKADPFRGFCPYHGDCFEGLASGPAIEARWGIPGEKLPPKHPAWILEARYIALALANLVYTVSPRRIVLGGGVMQNKFLFPIIRQNLLEILNNYIQSSRLIEGINDYILPPGLGSRSGVLGAIAMARQMVKL